MVRANRRAWKGLVPCSGDIREIRERLPFKVIGLDSESAGEFINLQLMAITRA
jgi:hypothetical protein